MTPLLQKILTLICLASIAMGICAGLLELAVYFNAIWSYSLGLGISILVILGAFEVVERSERG